MQFNIKRTSCKKRDDDLMVVVNFLSEIVEEEEEDVDELSKYEKSNEILFALVLFEGGRAVGVVVEREAVDPSH
jgi:hypothetical protein